MVDEKVEFMGPFLPLNDYKYLENSLVQMFQPFNIPEQDFHKYLILLEYQQHHEMHFPYLVECSISENGKHSAIIKSDAIASFKMESINVRCKRCSNHCLILRR